jgi:hypothetical protein
MKSARSLRTTGTDAERLLLAAGAAEKPDAESVRKTAVGLGLLPKAVIVGGAMTLALRGMKWTTIAVRGALPVGIVAAAIVVAYGVRERSRVDIPIAVTPAARIVSGSSTDPNADAPVATASAIRSAPTPTEARPVPGNPVAPHSNGRAAARASPSAVPVDSLREQAERIDRARSLISAGDPNGALIVLDDFDRRFAGGPLSEESMLLRIEGLARRGDRGSASVLARRFLTTYPASVHVDRASALLDTLSP